MTDDLTRRGLIVSGAAAAAVAGLAACSTPTATTTAPATAAAAAPATSQAAASGTTAAASAPVPAGAVSVKASSVPVGGGTILENAKYVVTQPTSGSYKAFNKTCTHQGCPVARIVGTEIVCTCHNSKFSIADGSVTQPPATKPLSQATVTVQGDTLLITG